MNQLQIFENESIGKIRAKRKAGEVWFAAKDVCHILNIGNPTMALRKLKNGWLNKIEVPHPQSNTGKTIKINAVNEPGLYKLVFRSNKPGADQFTDWIAEDVLPSIRKTGKYELEDKKDSYMIDDPIKRAQRWIEERKEKQRLEKENKKLKPKANKYDDFMNTEGLIEVKSAAQIMDIPGIGQNKLFEILRKEDVFYKKGKQNRVYQKYINRGYFKIKETPFNIGEEKVLYEKILFTPKGIDWLKGFLERNGYKKSGIKLKEQFA